MLLTCTEKRQSKKRRHKNIFYDPKINFSFYVFYFCNYDSKIKSAHVATKWVQILTPNVSHQIFESFREIAFIAHTHVLLKKRNFNFFGLHLNFSTEAEILVKYKNCCLKSEI